MCTEMFKFLERNRVLKGNKLAAPNSSLAVDKVQNAVKHTYLEHLESSHPVREHLRQSNTSQTRLVRAKPLPAFFSHSRPASNFLSSDPRRPALMMHEIT